MEINKLSKESKLLLIVILMIFCLFMVYFIMPAKIRLYEGWVLDFGVDWFIAYRPALWNILHGISPYDTETSSMIFLNPPWALIPLLPLSFLSDRLAISILAVVNYFCFGIIGYHLSGSWKSVALLLLAPPILLVSLAGNIDGIAALGIIMPPQLGIFFIALKPQSLGFVSLIWLLDSWRKGGFFNAARVFLPFGVVFAGSLVLFGPWPFTIMNEPDVSFNTIITWPYAIPIGLILLTKAVQDNDIETSILAAPFISPYLHTLSFAIPVLGLINNRKALTSAVIGFWIVVLILFL